MREKNLAKFALALVFVVILASPALGGGYFSVLWSDRDQCSALPGCAEQWRVKVNYRLEWEHAISWLPVFYTDGDFTSRGNQNEPGHFKPLHAWLGGGIMWSTSNMEILLGGTSGHYFDRNPPIMAISRTYNYGEVRWIW